MCKLTCAKQFSRYSCASTGSTVHGSRSRLKPVDDSEVEDVCEILGRGDPRRRNVVLIESLGEAENLCLFEGRRPSEGLRSTVEGDSRLSTCIEDLEPSRDVNLSVTVSADALDPCLS